MSGRTKRISIHQNVNNRDNLYSNQSTVATLLQCIITMFVPSCSMYGLCRDAEIQTN